MRKDDEKMRPGRVKKRDMRGVREKNNTMTGAREGE